MPGLSTFSIFVFQESDGQLLRSWIAGPRMLAVTGWLFSIDAKRPFQIRIAGVDIPAVVNTRTVQVVIADETGLAIVKEWGVVQLDEALSASRMGLIFVDEVTYD